MKGLGNTISKAMGIVRTTGRTTRVGFPKRWESWKVGHKGNKGRAAVS